jgi:hypothetical protein
VKIIRTDDSGQVILQGSDAWKLLRIGMVTASMIIDIVSKQKKDPTKYMAGRANAIRSMVVERLTGKDDFGFTSKYMKDGIEREPYARVAYEERTGHIVEEVAFVQHDWMKVGVSPDGMIVGSKRLVEFKCPKDTTHYDYLYLPGAPEEYMPQMQAQLWITECDVCDFVSWHPDFPKELQLHIVEVKRDDAYIEMLEREVFKFLAEVNVEYKKCMDKIAAIRVAATDPMVEQEELAA